jgi:hypothetical protein
MIPNSAYGIMFCIYNVAKIALHLITGKLGYWITVAYVSLFTYV